MNSSMNRSAAAIMLATLAVSATARASDLFWVGAGATTNWTNANNWFGFNRPGNDGLDNVYMDDVTQHTTNSVNQDYWINRLVFDVEDGRESTWTINQSNAAILSIDSRISNFTSKAQTVNVPVKQTSDMSISNSAGGATYGALNVGAINLNGNDLSVYPASSGISLTGTISGAGNVWIDGVGSVSLSGSNSWNGLLVIRRGTVTANAGANLGSINNRIVFNQSDATSLPTLVRNSSGTIGIPISFDSGEGRIETPAGVSVTISSGLDGVAGGGSFAKTGLGTVVLTAPAIKYNQTIVRAGTLQLAANTAVSSLGLQVLNGSTLSLNANIAQAVRSLDGFGSVQLGNSAELSIGQPFDLASVANGIGAFGGVMSGGTALLIKQGAGTFTLSGSNTFSGITDVRGGVLVVNNAAAGSSATGTSTVSVKLGTRLAGDGAIGGPVVIDGGGQISPSNVATPDAGIGSLITGELTLLGGASTRIEYTSTAMDRINVTGVARINGSLELNRVGTATPALSSVRQLLSTTGSITGVFSSVSNVNVSATESWAVTYANNGIFATIASPGDINLDSAINFNDLLLMAQNYGGADIKTWSTGDMSGDGAANFNDLLILAQNYGQSFDADWSLAQSMVPEPTAIFALAPTLPALLRRRR